MSSEQAQSSVGSPGARLQVARTQAGLSIGQAAEQLHLPADTLAAIEAGQFDRLGASIYVRAHLRRYAQLLGIADDEILSSYDAWSGRLAMQPDLRQIITAPAVRSGTRSFQLRPRQALIGAIVIVLLGLIWWAVHKKPAATVVAAAAPVAAAIAPATAPAVTIPAPAAIAAVAVPPAPPVAVAAPAAVAAPPAAVAAPPVAALARTAKVVSPMATATTAGREPMQLTLKFRTASWTEIYDADGSRLFHGLARAGSRHQVSGSPPLRLFIGNPTGVAMEMNGQPLTWGSAHGAGRFTRFTLDAAGGMAGASNASP